MLGGKYQVLNLLGQGGMGTVYRVRQVFLNNDMALKLLDLAFVADSIHIRRFQQEAKAANSLNHPGLVKVHDFGLLDNGQPYLVMEMLEGETLSSYLKKNGALSLKEINALFAQVCFALSYAHSEKVVHRDIKPGNIMLLQGLSLDTEGSVKVVDFGLAKIAGEGEGKQALTRTGEVMGSPIYMSPEQCSGATLDHRSDIYSLGCVLFEALTGTPPFIGETALRTMMQHQSDTPPTLKEASLGKDFPSSLERIVAKMLAKSPGDRYQDLGVVAHELAHACVGSDRVLEPKRTKTRKAAPAISLTPANLALLISGTIVCSSTLTLFTLQSPLFSHAQPTSQQQPLTQKQSVATSPKEDKGNVPDDGMSIDPVVDMFANQNFNPATNTRNMPLPHVTGPIISQITTTKDGQKVREFQFPKIAIGRITNKWAFYLTSGHAAEGSVSREAQSTCRFPVGMPLTLEIDILKHPELVKCINVYQAIGVNEFAGLLLKKREIRPSGAVLNEHEFFTRVLKQAVAWTQLKAVGFAHLVVGPHEIAALDEMKSLLIFDSDCCVLDETALHHSHFLQNLDTLIVRITNFGSLAPKLKGSTKLKLLCINECTLAPDQIEDVRNCPNLQTVIVSQKDYRDDMIKAIADLHQVKFFDIGGNLTPAQIRVLLTAPRLEHLWINSEMRRTAAEAGIHDRRIATSVDEPPE
jgi:serine/threonine protein kinase